MEFRHLGKGRYFPPVAPNGRIYATPIGQENQVEIFSLTSQGIVGAGITSSWSGILGFYYDDVYWEITLHNYRGRGLRFRRDVPCIIVAEGCEVLVTSIQGFAIPFCVMNRVAFEQQAKHHSAHLGSA